MRFVRFTADGSVAWGVQVDDQVHDLRAHATGVPSYSDVAYPGYRNRVRDAVDRGSLPVHEVGEVKLLAPVPKPGKMICVGLNYHDHAEEQDEDVPEKPMLFAKASSSVTNPEDPIVHPNDVEQVDYEVELGVVVGRTARNVDEADAADYVAGYTVVNDVSARDAQFEDEQFFRGKSYDTFAPMGPALVTGDELDPNDLAVECTVNGDVKQSSTTAEFIFDVGELVEYLSHRMTLHPGDVISTGTPGGVGIFRDPPELLDAGDSVTVSVEGVGDLTNPVVADD
ncbi:2-keto-4-pentenoate hydratase/2-oxohepta-3-ene-1,7-dioic acid hydratase (catechol pathway) [Halopelagius inordinatus]|uniref:2-keto-4-pentenoate hydratase/2-oxohepta-3-ene-1,7-dioic acid hydratase (Catechol pathway) n=1 Tax=Halopelagius inordinatus TaxID=553467 RepID=A0A1I2VTJ1_9EURY|nr:fumarylacetoacetate hydrolase family protein [Halopelagius inordinatus]SFG92383.1 2-keto-4-pentenoate hydratase/2-oxohepta-3-ene-1,7-dioic acid hydratase (catechol pathway) [Halopelagius inordinatus]